MAVVEAVEFREPVAERVMAPLGVSEVSLADERAVGVARPGLGARSEDPGEQGYREPTPDRHAPVPHRVIVDPSTLFCEGLICRVLGAGLSRGVTSLLRVSFGLRAHSHAVEGGKPVRIRREPVAVTGDDPRNMPLASSVHWTETAGKARGIG